MEPILEIETDLLPPEQIPTAPFEFPKAWSKSTISETDYFFRFPRECVAELENLNIELQKNALKKVNDALSDTYYEVFPTELPLLKEKAEEANSELACAFKNIMKNLIYLKYLHMSMEDIKV